MFYCHWEKTARSKRVMFFISLQGRSSARRAERKTAVITGEEREGKSRKRRWQGESPDFQLIRGKQGKIIIGEVGEKRKGLISQEA